MDATRWVALAEVARPHGIRGEVKLRVYNQDSDVLLELDEVLVRLATGEEHEVSIDVARRADKSILLKLHAVDDRNRAEEPRGEFEVPVTDAFVERIAVGRVHLTTMEGIELGKPPAKPEPREG